MKSLERKVESTSELILILMFVRVDSLAQLTSMPPDYELNFRSHNWNMSVH